MNGYLLFLYSCNALPDSHVLYPHCRIVQRYNMLVMQCTKEHSELDINLDDATLLKEYNGDIQSNMNGSFSNLVAKTFKVITKKKVFIPGKFANSNQQACVKCALR